MSIKTIPVCPFCHNDMNKVTIDIHSDGVEMIKNKKDVVFQLPSGGEIKQATYIETRTFYIYKCTKCGFVALWEHEL